MRARRLLIAVVLGAVLIVIIGTTIWYKFYREAAQPNWITSDQRNNFIYGSIGTESTAGIPYWIWLALPRMFPEYLPGPGGYASLGFPWEEGREMPVGFSKKIVGYVRVAGNCAACHAVSYRKALDDVPAVVPLMPSHDSRTDRLLLFFAQCAKDPRFNPTDILAEINMATKLSLLDRMIYRFFLIPRTRKAMLDGRSVFIGAELRAHSHNPQSRSHFSQSLEEPQERWLKQLKAPPYPLPIDAALASVGKGVFAQHCSSCHAADIPGKPNATDSAPPLDGIWIRGPYLKNRSVPTIRDLLDSLNQRPVTFYQGDDLIDTKNMGFISTEASDMGRQFLPYDTKKPRNGNAGHLFGTDLSSAEKNALLEYLKSL